MDNENLKLWNSVEKPPKEALKEIKGGRLKGMTDIKPQWRYKTMTEQFGMCGVGWKYVVTRKWTEVGSHEQLLCFVDVDLHFQNDGKWSDAIPGTGGSTLVAKESNGLHTSDEGYKMALTDALGVAMAKLGVASEIYMGNWTGSKYKDTAESVNKEHPANKSAGQKESTGENDTTIEVLLMSLKCKTTKDDVHKWKRDNDKTIEELGEDRPAFMKEYLAYIKELP